MKLLTFIPLDEIAEYEKLEGAGLNTVKERLAHEITMMVHGKEEADKALAAAKALFGSGAADENMPSTTLHSEDFTDGQIGVLALLVKTGLASSNGEARKLVQGGGVSLDGEKVSDPKMMLSMQDFAQGCVIKKGKKTYHKVIAG
jgi:tyrosyl-tRNA synthetase